MGILELLGQSPKTEKGQGIIASLGQPPELEDIGGIKGLLAALKRADQYFSDNIGAAAANPLGLVKGAAKGFQDAVTLPREVYDGKIDPRSEEGIQRAADMAGTITLGAGAVPAEANSLRAGIKAYHGSPHDFDKFSLDKIGTGEGAQAYGHGLYFAENENVAKGYRDALTPGTGTGPADIAARLLKDGDQETALAEIRRRIDDANARGVDYADIKRLMDAKNIINTAPQKATGRMYEVDLNANPDHFIDYDAPLGGQPAAAVSKIAEKIAGKDPNNWRAQQLVEDIRSGAELSGASALSRLKEAMHTSGKPRPWKETDARLSNELNKAGIPGVKYLDNGSRGAGDGTRNYVAFSDDIVNIVRKYGIAGLAALPPAVLIANGIDPKSLQGAN